jgi:hypothetical protein
MDVLIIEIKTGKVAATIPITMAGQNYIPSERDFFAEAWRCAVEDKSIDPARRDEYSFRLIRSG